MSNHRNESSRASAHLERAGDNLRHAGDDIKDASRETGAAMEAAAGATLERTADVARTAERKAGRAAEGAADAAADAGRTVKDKASGAVTAVAETAKAAAGAAATAAGATADAAKGAGKAVGNAAMGAVTGTARAAGFVAGQVGAAADFVREAEPDAELRAGVSSLTAHSLDGAGNALVNAAPTIGRGTELVVEKVGLALNVIARPLATVLGAVAGTLGGWWNKAAEERFELPEAEDVACRAHFTSVTVVPAGMTYEQARTGYAVGYVASRSPTFQGRQFAEVEPDLRRGFGEEYAAEYDTLREFMRYGYDRGAGGGR